MDLNIYSIVYLYRPTSVYNFNMSIAHSLVTYNSLNFSNIQIPHRKYYFEPLFDNNNKFIKTSKMMEK